MFKLKKVTKGPMMNNKGEMCWAVYVDGQFVDVFTDGITAEKRRRELDKFHNRPHEMIQYA
jgi:hypothetical protein